VETYELTDVQWKLVKPVFDPKVRRGPKTRHSRRRMVEAVLWLARTGCRWRELPPRYGSWIAVAPLA
jgi:transposase